ncbi:MAG TPA: MarR family winged helix-turn-helix transcriptional regulator [Solirubrobacteraceae bacterium]|nr:MarR family winged helix-turn-helix transcriptional regulator [Solirubrobacteraceae bacterium]
MPSDAHPRPADEGPRPDDADYARLARLRAGIRGYLAWAERLAADHGLTPAQVQLALAVRADPSPAGPTLTDLAQTLLLRHHSVVGLVDRAERAGLVTRVRDEVTLSRVHVRLTTAGATALDAIAAGHLEWLARTGEEQAALWDSFARHGGREA